MNRFGTGNTPRTLGIMAAVVAVLVAGSVSLARDSGRPADAAKTTPAAEAGPRPAASSGTPAAATPVAPTASPAPADEPDDAGPGAGAGPGTGAAGGSAGAGGGAGGATGGKCASVKVVAARGTGEPAGTGFLLGQVARQIDAKVSAPVTIVGLNYPASSDFANSSRQGVAELRRLVGAERAGACLVLLGYSQGAIVVGDALAALNSTDAAKVRAVVMFGDPRFNSAEPYNKGNFAPNSRGLNPRRTGELARFNARIQDFCNGGDTVCQGNGAKGTGSHLDYNKFATQAAAFAAAKV